MNDSQPELVVSACLLGSEVRFDGGHKRDRFITDRLSEWVKLRSVCPEVTAGMGTPREPIRLVSIDGATSVRATRDVDRDYSEMLHAGSVKCLEPLAGADGVILKKDSPSCGPFTVKYYSVEGHPADRGDGLYAGLVRKHHPLLPVEHEGRLCDAVLRENFLTRVFVHHRWRRFRSEGVSRGGLIQFHTRHKLLLLAHDQAAYRRLGRMLADAGGQDIEPLADRYFKELMCGLNRRATRGNHANALQHILGYLRPAASAEDRQHIDRVVSQYREGTVPLIVPVTLLRDYFRRHPDPYIDAQYYLQPYPAELMLRNTI